MLPGRLTGTTKSIEQMRLTADICLRGVCAVGAGEQDEVNR